MTLRFNVNLNPAQMGLGPMPFAPGLITEEPVQTPITDNFDTEPFADLSEPILLDDGVTDVFDATVKTTQPASTAVTNISVPVTLPVSDTTSPTFGSTGTACVGSRFCALVGMIGATAMTADRVDFTNLPDHLPKDWMNQVATLGSLIKGALLSVGAEIADSLTTAENVTLHTNHKPYLGRGWAGTNPMMGAQDRGPLGLSGSFRRIDFRTSDSVNDRDQYLRLTRAEAVKPSVTNAKNPNQLSKSAGLKPANNAIGNSKPVQSDHPALTGSLPRNVRETVQITRTNNQTGILNGSRQTPDNHTENKIRQAFAMINDPLLPVASKKEAYQLLGLTYTHNPAAKNIIRAFFMDRFRTGTYTLQDSPYLTENPATQTLYDDLLLMQNPESSSPQLSTVAPLPTQANPSVISDPKISLDQGTINWIMTQCKAPLSFIFSQILSWPLAFISQFIESVFQDQLLLSQTYFWREYARWFRSLNRKRVRRISAKEPGKKN